MKERLEESREDSLVNLKNFAKKKGKIVDIIEVRKWYEKYGAPSPAAKKFDGIGYVVEFKDGERFTFNRGELIFLRVRTFFNNIMKGNKND